MFRYYMVIVCWQYVSDVVTLEAPACASVLLQSSISSALKVAYAKVSGTSVWFVCSGEQTWR